MENQLQHNINWYQLMSKEPTSKRVDLQQSEAMQWLRDLTLHSGQGYDDDDDVAFFQNFR